MGYTVSLEVFHGPLDLLLYLIDKNQVDIYDIPIAEMSDQFLEYVEKGNHYDLEVMGEFLVMASYLLQLKSLMLLPKPEPKEEMEEEQADPREELVEKLVAYKQIKEAAEFLDKHFTGELDRIFYRGGTLKPEERTEIAGDLGALLKAYQHICRRMEDPGGEYLLLHQDIDIEDRAEAIMAELDKYSGKMNLQDLFLLAVSRREALVLFLALLELVRQQKIRAVQEHEFGAIILMAQENDDVG